jgi:hypothetical protein
VVIFIATLMGAFVGVAYALGRTSESTRRSVAIIKGVEIDESDPVARRARAEALGYNRGLRLSGCIVFGAIGAALGAVIGIIMLVV